MKTKIFTTLFALLFTATMVFAQDTTKLMKKELMKTNSEMQKDSVYYTCTMHQNVKLDKPGKCPECGMQLVKKSIISETGVNKSEGLVTYTCKMHPEITASVPGKCPKCNMDLVPKK
jgi:hypothetical protein